MKRFAILAVLMLPSCGNVETGDVLVKGGTFIPGNDTIYPEEKTGAAITVFDFYMDRYEGELYT